MPTITATLARAQSIPRSVSAGMQAVSDRYSTGATVLSASGSGMIWLAKIPDGATIHGIREYHTAGATALALNMGLRNGRSASSNITQILSDATKGALNQGVPESFPISVSCDAAANESFKYLVCTIYSDEGPSPTTSLQINYTLTYSMDQDQDA